jgi:hypothetical protein
VEARIDGNELIPFWDRHIGHIIGQQNLLAV